MAREVNVGRSNLGAGENRGGGSGNVHGTAAGGSSNNLARRPPQSSAGASSSVGKIVTPNLKVFTLAELKAAAKGFKSDTVLGEGGFGRVFKGWIDQTTLEPSKYGVGMAVAIKKCSPDSTQGIKEWKVLNSLFFAFRFFCC